MTLVAGRRVGGPPKQIRHIAAHPQDKTAARDTRLLGPGWAGECAADELRFIKGALKSNRRLWTAWGFVHGTGRINEGAIRVVAMRGLPDDRAHNVALVTSIKAGSAEPGRGSHGGGHPRAVVF